MESHCIYVLTGLNYFWTITLPLILQCHMPGISAVGTIFDMSIIMRFVPECNLTFMVPPNKTGDNLDVVGIDLIILYKEPFRYFRVILCLTLLKV